MEIAELFEQYAAKVSQIHLYQRAVKNNAQKELAQLNDYAETLKNRPELKECSSSFDNMFFYSAIDGNAKLFGNKVSSIEDRQLAVVLHKNKQYQWLLSEAYEAFEDYIEVAYAYMGYKNVNTWPLKDFGNIYLNELDSKEFGWYLEKTNNKQEKPKSILNQFRKVFPELQTLESNNKLKINLKLAVILIEHLRHIIVHKGGTVSDKENFHKIVLKKSGLYTNGRLKEEHVNFIDSFFGTGDYQETIVLLEIPIKPEIPLDFHIDLFKKLSGYLLAYAHLITGYIQSEM